MLFKDGDTIYIMANNKFYKVEVVNGNLVPTKECKYEIDKSNPIEIEEAKDFLKKGYLKEEFSPRIKENKKSRISSLD